MQGWRLGHRPGLDGLRGIAVAMVLAGHAGWGPKSIHAVGVEVFFVLSGFLITSLLVEEWADHGRIDLRRFYVRRARRLLPALFLMLGVMALLAWRNEVPRAMNSRGVLAGFTYSTNWVRIETERLGSLGHLWSLSIEEHFYLVWPAVLLTVLAVSRRLTVALWVTVALWAGSMSVRFTLHGSQGLRLGMGDDTRAAALLVGCVAAIVVHLWRMWEPSPRSAIVAGVAAVGVVWWASCWSWTNSGRLWLGVLPAANAATLAAVLLCCSTNPVARVMSAGWLTRLGAISYGVYLWHAPIYRLVGAADSALVARTTIAIMATLVVATASYRYVEQPIRQRGFRAWVNSRNRVADDHDAGTTRPGGVIPAANISVPAATATSVSGSVLSDADVVLVPIPSATGTTGSGGRTTRPTAAAAICD